MSAVVKLLPPPDEFEEPVLVTEGGELDVEIFVERENEVTADRVVDSECKTVGVVLDAVGCSVPVRTKRWRVNTVLKAS
jgi:hypothetical protein